MLYLKGDFEKLYKLYYPKMFAFAKNYVPANEDAENIEKPLSELPAAQVDRRRV